jgi:hypothetical protein
MEDVHHLRAIFVLILILFYGSISLHAQPLHISAEFSDGSIMFHFGIPERIAELEHLCSNQQRSPALAEVDMRADALN